VNLRKGLWLTVALLGSTAGCQLMKGGSQAPTGPTANATKPAGAPSMVTWDRDVKEPTTKKATTPEVCVSYANFRLGESLGADYDAVMRDRMQEDARDAYQKALSLDPNHIPAFRGLAHLYVLRGDYPRAIQQYQTALKAAPNDATLWFDAGVCANYAQQWDRAVGALQRAVELDPQNRTYANALGVVLARVGKLDASLQAFARMNSQAQAHYNLGCTLRRLGDPQRGRYYLELAVQKDPHLNTAQTLLAEMAPPPTAGQPIERAGYMELIPEGLDSLPPGAP
jgi:tetratricopeptide (TPR) repeat protein